MRRVPCLAGLVATGLAVACCPAASAQTCFPASGAVNNDAQTIRLEAERLGWNVGVVASMTAASVVKSKVALYPQGKVTVCLNDTADGLAVRAQASTGDDRDAAWKKLPAKRKGA